MTNNRDARERSTQLGGGEKMSELPSWALENLPKNITYVSKEEREAATKEMSLAELRKTLGLTIKRDDTNKIIHFLAGVLTYTDNSQINISNRGPSSSGKSYIPLELATLYFPPQDVMMIAYSSPTSFYHDSGEWDNERKAVKIDLERKILVFLDQPHDELLRRLRPLLSHDCKELLYKITDKREKKGLRTKNVIIRGFPSVFFCTGSLRIEDQEATRNIVLSPETTREKIRQALYLKALRKGNPYAYERLIGHNKKRELLKKRILLIRQAKIKNITLKDTKGLVKKFIEKYPSLKPRHTRDVGRVISLAQGLALLNLWNRAKDNGIFVKERDINNAFRIYGEIAECQELGIPPYTHKIYKEVFLPLFEELDEQLRLITQQGGVVQDATLNKEDGTTPPSNVINYVGKKEIISKFYSVYGRMLNTITLDREILPSLEAAGLIVQENDPTNKRRHIYLKTSTPTTPNAPLAQAELMARLGGFYFKFNGWNLTQKVFLARVKAELPNERESRLREASTRMSFRICKEANK